MNVAISLSNSGRVSTPQVGRASIRLYSSCDPQPVHSTVCKVGGFGGQLG